jgi:hypothetical protein
VVCVAWGGGGVGRRVIAGQAPFGVAGRVTGREFS